MNRFRPSSHPAALPVVLALLALSSTAQAQGPATGDPTPPDYEATLSLAARLEAEGDFAGAAHSLETLVPAFPQDYRLQLQLGWLHFCAGDYPAAELAYRKALALSGGALDPRLGLAWTALRERHRDLAVEGFEAVLAEDPGNDSAAEGLDLARQLGGLRATPYLAATLRADSGRDWALGLTLGLPLVIQDRFLLRATYRRIAGFGGSSMGFGRPAIGGATAAQHEVHGAVGLRTRPFELTLHAAHLFALADAPSPASVGGLRLRASPFGDLLAEASASVYPDGALWRLALGWRSPALGGLRLQPGFALQRTPGAWRPSGSLTLSLQRGGLGLWLGGKVGEEDRVTRLEPPSLFNLEQTLGLGLWAGLLQHFEQGWGLGVELEVHQLMGDGLTTPDGLLILTSLVVTRDL